MIEELLDIVLTVLYMVSVGTYLHTRKKSKRSKGFADMLYVSCNVTDQCSI